ncbi:MAG: hypothetical protein A3J66_01730 [Candidatus Magasanikbacteria bacterium RIFCSPHIGHO2_02_FULL_47_14]|uniref:Vitamin K epoxide reductase domain-containing protein n=1 Tax=Candidatus Magasanikbacteria bacterium RIFCSPHIGHO2_02_FULL_47_14 TaxID=1798680 RepID=A0A1F6MA26_9BACT|nr:MAG: hypothetical protein A3J66_01730 [Candidatus Magasanikbacteria bacterium RIFCSPHIGHO2_02_FULL_47_14]
MNNPFSIYLKPAVLLLTGLFFLISLLGLADATYLTVAHYRAGSPGCVLIEGCDLVTTSVYSMLGPIPVALLGIFYYATIFVLSLLFATTQKIRLFRLLCFLTPLGFLASLWFVYLQLSVLDAICLYCMGSALSSTLLFIFGMIGIRYHRS